MGGKNGGRGDTAAATAETGMGTAANVSWGHTTAAAASLGTKTGGERGGVAEEPWGGCAVRLRQQYQQQPSMQKPQQQSGWQQQQPISQQQQQQVVGGGFGEVSPWEVEGSGQRQHQMGALEGQWGGSKRVEDDVTQAAASTASGTGPGMRRRGRHLM